MRLFRTHTYAELEERIFDAGSAVPFPQTLHSAAQTAYDMGLIARRALRRAVRADRHIDTPPIESWEY